MNTPRLLFCLMSFAAGLALVPRNPEKADRAADAITASRMIPAEVPGQETEGWKRSAGSGEEVAPEPLAPLDPEALPEEALRLAGLREQPGLREVLESAGLERRLRMNLFLRALREPEELAAALDGCGQAGKMDPGLLDLIWLRWVDLDAGTALERSGAGGRGWWAFGKKDPAAALEAARASGPEAMAGVIRAIAEGDPAEGARLAALHPESASREVWAGLAESLVRGSPTEAAAVALRKNLPLDRIAADWVERDAQAALAWAARLPEAWDRRRMTAELIRQWSQREPEAALREASKLPPGRDSLAVFNDSLSALAARDPQRALNLAAAQPAGYARESAYAVMARGLAATDSDGALKALSHIDWAAAGASNEIKWSVAFGGEPTFSADTQAPGESGPAFDALRELMRTAPDRTAAAMAALPPEAKAPLPLAVKTWLGQDPEGASEWLRAQSPGAAKNDGIRVLSHWLIQEAPQPDYEAALAWAESSTAADRAELLRWVKEEKEIAEATGDRGGREAEILRFRRSLQSADSGAAARQP